MYNCVIFDVDGTLFDTSRGIFECINCVLREKKLPELSEDELKKFIGPPILESFQKYCGFNYEFSKELTETYRSYYIEKYIQKSYMYSGMKKLLDQIKAQNIKIAIATLKTQLQIDTLLRNENLDSYFDIVCGVTHTRISKADSIVYIANMLKMELDSMVMIGDSALDGAEAVKAGVDFIGITYGFGLKGEDDLADIPYKKLCNSVDELRAEIG